MLDTNEPLRPQLISLTEVITLLVHPTPFLKNELSYKFLYHMFEVIINIEIVFSYHDAVQGSVFSGHLGHVHEPPLVD